MKKDLKSSSRTPTETDLLEAERGILADVHRWGLHMGEYGRLSVMNQLAMLQHFGAPTRLIDITFNPWIGLWFAVQELPVGSGPQPDARLFAFDVTDRLINERSRELRGWEDDVHVPWPERDREKEGIAYSDWIKTAFAWRPPRFNPRLAAQNGGFMLGGVPSPGMVSWPKTTRSRDGSWGIGDVRRRTSVAIRAHKLDATAGGPSKHPAMYTMRVESRAVAEIRERLKSRFQYEPSIIYPDFPGFAEFGTPGLMESPPEPAGS